MKLLLTGGRDFDDADAVCDLLDILKPETLIHGDCPTGADNLAHAWADEQSWPGFKHAVYYADWKREGRRAGPLRNQEMINLEKPDLCLAFPGGRGTEDCVRRACKAKIYVLEFKP